MRSLVPLHLGIFLDLLGFGMIFPVIQFRAEAMGAHGWLIGVILASTFAIQFVVSPWWGRASDRFGRKPILLACNLLSGLGLLLYAPAYTPLLLLISRSISGLGGANVAIAQAFVADATGDDARTKAMGHLGAAVSAGLILGPSLGGFLAASGHNVVGYAAGSSSLLGSTIILFLIPHIPPKERTNQSRPLFDFSLLKHFPSVRRLAVVAAVAWFSLATLEGTFGRLIKHTLGFGESQMGIVFGYESLLSFLVQAVLLSWAAKRMNDVKLLRTSYVLQGLGLALTPFTYLYSFPSMWLLVLLMFSTLYAVGAGFANPTINSLCSKLTPEDRQGELFGLLQGARSVGFLVGPILGGALFDQWFAAPYLLAGATCVLAAALVNSGNVAAPVAR